MLFVYLHLAVVMSYFGLLIASHITLADRSAESVKKAHALETFSFSGALLSLVSGVSLLFLAGKPVEFYFKNGATHTKLTLFVVLFVLAWINKSKIKQLALASLGVTKSVLMIQRVQLLCLLALPLFGLAMSRGGF